MTIVRNWDWVRNHPFILLGDELRTKLHLASGVHSSKARWQPFEAYLQLTKHPSVDVDCLGSDDLQRTVQLFVGALHSKTFIAESQHSRYLRCRNFLSALQTVDSRHKLNAKLSPKYVTDQADEWRRQFELLPLDEEAIWLWGGWGSKTKRGDNVSFSLYPLYSRLGRKFTQDVCDVLDTMMSRRAHKSQKVLSAFCRYVGEVEGPVSQDSFHDKYWCGRFFMEFAHHYFREMKAKGNNIKHAAGGWKNSFVPLVEALSQSNVIAAPEPPVPAPRAGFVVTGVETHIRRSQKGEAVKVNCLTQIPLSLSDSDAKELLFREIRDDFAAVVTWAESEVDDLWKRHTKAQELAREGKVRLPSRPLANAGVQWLTDPANPCALANCAATYKANGHQVSLTAQLAYKSMGLVNVARELGVPTPMSLLPHAALLVANHAQMTSEFLSSLELFDRDGKLSGFQENDGGAYLVGYKRRRKEKLAEQKILLNSRTADVVRQVVAVTAPLREYLKGKRDDRWRLLFLTVGSVTANPVSQHFANQCCKPERYGVDGMVASLCRRSKIGEADASRLVAGFSLRSLRASAALIVYLNTESALKMSQALGHETYNPKLLDHYLPEPIQRFFRERWIRLFQAGIVCEAMKDSEFLLEASGFSTMDELDLFLERHALKEIPCEQALPISKGTKKSAATEVVFEVSESVLTALHSLVLAVSQTTRAPTGRAAYWAEIGRRVTSYIEAQEDRPDLMDCLSAAKQRASASLVAELIYA